MTAFWQSVVKPKTTLKLLHLTATRSIAMIGSWISIVMLHFLPVMFICSGAYFCLIRVVLLGWFFIAFMFKV